MRLKRVPLTEQDFQALAALSGWQIDEVPGEHWDKIPGLQRREEILAIMASGDTWDPRILNRLNAIAGMDVLVAESNRMPGEPEGNAYHYVFIRSGDSSHPYVMYGPYRSETRVDHWFEAVDLECYWQPVDGESDDTQASGGSGQ